MDGGVGRAITALYTAAVSDDPAPMEVLITSTHVRSAERLAEYVYAYACAATRAPLAGDANARFAVMDAESTEPFTDGQLRAACRSMVNARATKSALGRAIAYTLCCRAFGRLQWTLLESAADTAARVRMVKLLSTAARTCSYGTYGDTYVEGRVRLALPNWSTVGCPHGQTPHAVAAEVLQAGANDTVRSILDTPVAAALGRSAWSSRAGIGHCACAAVATMQELTGGCPRLLINEAVIRHAGDDGAPSVALIRGMAPGAHTMVAVVTGLYAERSDHWGMPVADALVEYLVAARDLGVAEVSDMAACILDGATSTPLAVHMG